MICANRCVSSSSWLGFANEDLGRTSTSSTGTLVADEAYTGQAGPATVAAGKGLVQDECWGDTFFFLLLMSSILALRVSSKSEMAWGTVRRQESRSAAYVYPLTVINAVRDFFKESLYRFRGAPMFRYPEDNSPYSTILGRRYFSILDTCPAHRSCTLRTMASILIASANSRTSVLATKSLQRMLRTVRRQRWWKRSRSLRWWRYVTQDSAPYRRVVSTTALYTLTFVSFLRLLLFQTRPYSLLNALFALASLLSTSLSILASDEITHPK